MSDGCVSLTGSQSCDMYSHQALYLPGLAAGSAANKNFTSIGFGAESVKDVESFDRWINASSRGVAAYYYTSFARGNCSGITPSTVTFRYLTSMLCVQSVLFQSTPRAGTPGCAQNVQTPTPVLCSDVCNDFASSYLSVLSNTSFCNLSRDFVNKVTAAINGVCSAMVDGTFASPASSCTSGSLWDAQSCGFGLDKIDQARAFCRTPAGQTSACCSRLYTGDSDAAPAATTLDVFKILLIAVAGAVLLVLVALAAYFGSRAARRRARAKTASAKAPIEGIHTAASAGIGKSAIVGDVKGEADASEAAAAAAMGGSGIGIVVESGAAFNQTTFGTVWRAVSSYEPQMVDEIRLEEGDEVALETVFNDGWARGVNRSTGDAGYLPMPCLAPMTTAGDGYAKTAETTRPLARSQTETSQTATLAFTTLTDGATTGIVLPVGMQAMPPMTPMPSMQSMHSMPSMPPVAAVILATGAAAGPVSLSVDGTTRGTIRLAGAVRGPHGEQRGQEGFGTVVRSESVNAIPLGAGDQIRGSRSHERFGLVSPVETEGPMRSQFGEAENARSKEPAAGRGEKASTGRELRRTDAATANVNAMVGPVGPVVQEREGAGAGGGAGGGVEGVGVVAGVVAVVGGPPGAAATPATAAAAAAAAAAARGEYDSLSSLLGGLAR